MEKTEIDEECHMIKKYSLLIAIFYIFSFLLIGCSNTTGGDGYYSVTDVVDGDTIDVQIDGKEETIRLLLVDTPETVHPSKPVQPFGPEASDFMKELLKGEEVELEIGISERDKYGRILAYVYTKEGKMVNELLLKKGLARVAYIFPPNTKYVDDFREIQRDAQLREKGIWSIENYTTKDGFQPEEKRSESFSDECKIKGNLSSSGDKIYHMPDGAYYDVTEAERCFQSEKKAKGAGFRKSKR
jgi:micrococcal nuclease